MLMFPLDHISFLAGFLALTVPFSVPPYPPPTLFLSRLPLFPSTFPCMFHSLSTFSLLARTRHTKTDTEQLATPPSTWIEAYTRYNKEWITVDVSRKRMRCRGIMEPKGKQRGEGNLLAYVVGFEEGASVLPHPQYVSRVPRVVLSPFPQADGNLP